MVSPALIVGWIVFGCVCLVVCLLSLVFVRYYQDSYEQHWLLTVVSTVSISCSFITLMLIPLDVVSVSAGVTVRTLVQSLYYILFLSMMLLCFCVCPFVYFFFEEGVEASTARRIVGGLKWTIPFIVVLLIILIMGIVLPITLGQDLDDVPPYVQSLIKDLNPVSDAVNFMIGCVAVIGLIVFLTYTAFGFSWMPISWIKGRTQIAAQEEIIESEIVTARAERRSLQNKILSSRSTSQDSEHLNLLKRKDRVLRLRHEQLGSIGTVTRKCITITRPFAIVIGILLGVLSLFIVLSILLTSIDKLSPSAASYVLTHSAIFNPLDSLLYVCAPFFPLDYALFAMLVAFVWFATVSGVSRWGIRALWIEMFPMKRGRTAPQGLLLGGLLLMLGSVTLAFYISSIAPTYVAWGHQKYLVNNTLVSCDLEAPPSSNCTMTQIHQITSIVRFKFAFFRYVLYWCNWVFLAAWLAFVFVAICLRVRSGTEEYSDGEVVDEFLDRASARPERF